MAHLRVRFVALLALAGCGAVQKWTAPNVGVSSEILAREISPDIVSDVLPEDIPEIPPPRQLRPCCAFGSGLHVSLGPLPPLPAFELPNVLGVEDLGPHRYDNGALAFEASRPGGPPVTNEHNGLVYTCRGGFIDTAHVRDWADWTLFLAARLGRSLETGGDLELAPEGGRRRVELGPIDPEEIEGYDRREIVVPLAQWIAFQLSVWHEIATWYGWASIPVFPEEASAFSPEDLYSNLLGIRIAGSLIYQGAVVSEASYNENMHGALQMILPRLGAQPAEVGRRAARAVDGQWWDSRVALPDKRLVLRRNFASGISISPWLVQQAPVSRDPVSNEDRAALAALCREAGPIVLRNPDTCVNGRPFADYATVEIEVDEALARRGFPFPRPGSRTITQRDFAFVIERIRAQNAAEFGPDADRPD
jgi:Protein of unknown function (DUF4056)